MPDILKLMIKYKTPCIISTKSDLILRDYDLIEELSKTNALIGLHIMPIIPFITDNYKNIDDLYKTGSTGKEYKEELYKNVNEIKYKYGVSSNYSKVMEEKFNSLNNLQISFF